MPERSGLEIINSRTGSDLSFIRGVMLSLFPPGGTASSFLCAAVHERDGLEIASLRGMNKYPLEAVRLISDKPSHRGESI